MPAGLGGAEKTTPDEQTVGPFETTNDPPEFFLPNAQRHVHALPIAKKRIAVSTAAKAQADQRLACNSRS
jgi:hypothetical protein